jgi:hypothetical protein
VLATLSSFYRRTRSASQVALSKSAAATSPILVLKEPTKPAREQRDPVVLAEEWQQRTQLLALLNLDVNVKDMVRALGDPLTTRTITEKALRRLLPLAAG